MELDHTTAHRWYCGGKNYLLFDLKREVFVSPGDDVTNFRGQPNTIRSVSRSPEYNGTAKVIQGDTGWEVYSTVYDLVALPAVEPGKEYQLDVYNRDTMVRQLTTVTVERIVGGHLLHVQDPDDGERTIAWQDVYIANEVGVDKLIPV